jgi:hypothetical protein
MRCLKNLASSSKALRNIRKSTGLAPRRSFDQIRMIAPHVPDNKETPKTYYLVAGADDTIIAVSLSLTWKAQIQEAEETLWSTRSSVRHCLRRSECNPGPRRLFLGCISAIGSDHVDACCAESIAAGEPL